MMPQSNPKPQTLGHAHSHGHTRRQLHTDARSDHVLWLSVERMEWHRLAFRGNKPAARDGHACALHGERCVPRLGCPKL